MSTKIFDTTKENLENVVSSLVKEMGFVDNNKSILQYLVRYGNNQDSYIIRLIISKCCEISISVNNIEDMIFINGLYVDEKYRRQGIATKLIELSFKFGLLIQKQFVCLHIDKPYEEWLYNFYIKKWGFSVLSDCDTYSYLIKKN